MLVVTAPKRRRTAGTAESRTRGASCRSSRISAYRADAASCLSDSPARSKRLDLQLTLLRRRSKLDSDSPVQGHLAWDQLPQINDLTERMRLQL